MTSLQSPSVSASSCHLPMPAPQGGSLTAAPGRAGRLSSLLPSCTPSANESHLCVNVKVKHPRERFFPADPSDLRYDQARTRRQCRDDHAESPRPAELDAARDGRRHSRSARSSARPRRARAADHRRRAWLLLGRRSRGRPVRLAAQSAASVAEHAMRCAAITTRCCSRSPISTIPVVVAVNGPAAGVGCSFALSRRFHDRGQERLFPPRPSSISASFPTAGSSWLLPRLIGVPRALQMMMLGEKISADQAADWGMIYKSVEDADAPGRGQGAGARASPNGPTIALGTMRKVLRDGLTQDFAATSLDAEAKGQFIAGGTADAMETSRRSSRSARPSSRRSKPAPTSIFIPARPG